jgi:hypothetical protein
MRSILEKTKEFIFQTIILANEAGGHGELGEDGQEGLVRKLLQLGDQTRAEEGPRGGTPGGLKHMAVVDIGSSQQFEVVRIIFRTYSYPELSEISERFLILFGKANFSFTYLLHAERRYLVYELKFRNNFKYIVINVLQK